LDIHRPKAPIPGLKDFAKEVGIIVLGVLIVLAGEQLVEALRWRHQVTETKAARIDALAHDQLLSEASRDRYQKTLSDLRFYARASANLADESLLQLKNMNLLPPPADLRETLAGARKDFGGCVMTPVIR